MFFVGLAGEHFQRLANELIELGKINQMVEKAEKAPEPAGASQTTDEVKDTPELAETEKKDAGQPANTAKRQAKRRA